MRGFKWKRRWTDVRICERADEVEFRALKEDTASLTEALRDEKVDGSSNEENEVTIANKWLKKPEVADENVGAVSEELERRHKALGRHWPFELDGVTLRRRRETRALVYEFCLSISRAPTIVAKPYNELPVMFERLSLWVLQEWLGQHSKGVRTGWPRERGMRLRCKAMFAQIRRATRCSFEWDWNPDKDLPEDPDTQHLKEGKLDLLAWLPMPDGHGHVYFAGQCACGGEKEMDQKARELTASGLARWVKPPAFVPIVRCFFVPHVLPEARLCEIIREGGATFDRARLSMVADTLSPRAAKAIRRRLQECIDIVLKN